VLREPRLAAGEDKLFRDSGAFACDDAQREVWLREKRGCNSKGFFFTPALTPALYELGRHRERLFSPKVGV
jgi:hypothetical protein